MAKTIAIQLSEHQTVIERVTAFSFLLGIAVGLVLGSALLFKTTSQTQLTLAEKIALSRR